MDNQKRKSKFVYESGQVKVKISQCKNCINQNKNDSCAFFDQIPLEILINKVVCDKRKDK